MSDWPQEYSSLGQGASAPRGPVPSQRLYDFAWAMDRLYSALGNLARRPRPPIMPPLASATPDSGPTRSELYTWDDAAPESPTSGTPVVGLGGAPLTPDEAFQYFQRLPAQSPQGRGLPIEYFFYLEQPPQIYVDHAIPDTGIQGTGLIYGEEFSIGPGGPLQNTNWPYQANTDDNLRSHDLPHHYRFVGLIHDGDGSNKLHPDFED